MFYVLTNGRSYYYIDGKNTVLKTNDLYKAVKFDDVGKAQSILNKVTKKLKGFKVVELSDAQSKDCKVKRKSFSSEQRMAVYNRSEGKCKICGEFVPYDSFTVDHIIPIAKGGNNDTKNLQCACLTCNLIKQDILPQDLMEKLTQIMLYQMRKNYDNSIWKQVNDIRKKKKRSGFGKVLKTIIERKYYYGNKKYN